MDDRHSRWTDAWDNRKKYFQVFVREKFLLVGLRLADSGAMKMSQLESIKDKLSRKPFVVQYARTRYLAYRDAAGKLRHFWKQTLLPQSVLILDPED